MKILKASRLFILLCSIFAKHIFSQQTVGLFQYDSTSFDGYTLFAPLSYRKAFLIDNCGNEIHSWESTFLAGSSAHLLEDGNLLFTCKMPANSFPGSGGAVGRVEKYDWNNNLLWSWDYNAATHLQHHEIEPLPNGNILIVAWEKKSQVLAIASGRDTSLLVPNFWPEHVLEIEPNGSDSATIIWEWHMWDHLVQDFDNSKSNYGIVSDHPELIDINYVSSGPGGADIAHVNAIDYNPELDQIILTPRYFSEVWIIDHSTTTQEAASHTGGNSGMGGDILYRWGNSEAYQRGDSSDKILFGPHDGRWVADGNPGEGNITIFNNGRNRPGGDYSSIEEITSPVDSNGNYTILPGQPFGPALTVWYWTSPVPSDFFSMNISGAQRLPNGNTLVCEGASGNFFEIGNLDSIVWNYVNPVNGLGPVSQGSLPGINNVFKVFRYPVSYPGFAGQNLAPGDPIELNPLPPDGLCLPAGVENKREIQFKLFPNPVGEFLNIEFGDYDFHSVKIFSVEGVLVLETNCQLAEKISTEKLKTGMYFLVIDENLWKKFNVLH